MVVGWGDLFCGEQPGYEATSRLDIPSVQLETGKGLLRGAHQGTVHHLKLKLILGVSTNLPL